MKSPSYQQSHPSQACRETSHKWHSKLSSQNFLTRLRARFVFRILMTVSDDFEWPDEIRAIMRSIEATRWQAMLFLIPGLVLAIGTTLKEPGNQILNLLWQSLIVSAVLWWQASPLWTPISWNSLLYSANAKLSYPERAHKLWNECDGKAGRS